MDSNIKWLNLTGIDDYFFPSGEMETPNRDSVVLEENGKMEDCHFAHLIIWS